MILPTFQRYLWAILARSFKIFPGVGTIFCPGGRALAENFCPGAGLLTALKNFPGDVGAWN